jgi:hypothetical protein
MKATNNIIIYDDACPMCSAYTKAFVNAGLINPNGRKSFSTIDKNFLEQIDVHKCKNEIPLINTQTNKIHYGIDALLEILGTKFLLIKTIGNIRPVNWFLKKLYNLVSFNRRVITATKSYESNFDCTPDFNTKYRLVFLILGLCFNTLMLIPEYKLIMINSVFNHGSLVQLQAAHFVFVLVNILVAIKFCTEHSLEFLGQANMLALLTTLLLIPLSVLNYYMHIPVFINNAYFFLLFIFIIKEYKRRVQFADALNNKYVVAINIFSLICFFSYLLI